MLVCWTTPSQKNWSLGVRNERHQVVMVLALNLYAACCCLLHPTSSQRRCLLHVLQPSWWSSLKCGEQL